MRRAWPILLLLVACAGPEAELEPLPLASIEAFGSRVQPHLGQRCGSGGCHGRADRPLALFVPGAHRRDDTRTYLDEPLTAWELEENARRVASFAIGTSAADSLAVRKPLSIEAGGLWHGGGETFVDFYDPACVALSEWLDSRPNAGLPDGGSR